MVKASAVDRGPRRWRAASPGLVVRLVVRLVVLLVALGGPACGRGGGGVAQETSVGPPPAEVAALVDDALTTEGKRLLYGSDPKILDKAEFEVACPTNTELTVVLGCYKDGAIGILRVERPELSRVMEVTAAHEMLHAAYLALSTSDRQKVDSWLEEFYATVSDPEIRDLVGQYERRGPDVRLNELHSILPTEIAVLSPPLETYYRRYFADRQRIVAAHDSYEGVFRDLKRRVADLHGQIDSLKAELTSLEGRITTERSELDSLNSRLDRLRAQGDIRTYNSLIPQQNALAEEYNGLVDRYNDVVDVHNQKVDEVNGLALEQDELATSLGSKPRVAPARP